MQMSGVAPRSPPSSLQSREFRDFRHDQSLHECHSAVLVHSQRDILISRPSRTLAAPRISISSTCCCPERREAERKRANAHAGQVDDLPQAGLWPATYAANMGHVIQVNGHRSCRAFFPVLCSSFLPSASCPSFLPSCLTCLPILHS